MNIPENWLRSFADPDMPVAKLAHLLTMSGLEVESCVPFAPPFAPPLASAPICSLMG